MSLIYRLSRDFYIGQNSFYSIYINVPSADYANTIRNFILTRLRGRVTDMDFKSLQAMIFGRQLTFIEPALFLYTLTLYYNVPTELQLVFNKVCLKHFSMADSKDPYLSSYRSSII